MCVCVCVFVGMADGGDAGGVTNEPGGHQWAGNGGEAPGLRFYFSTMGWAYEALSVGKGKSL